MNMGSPLTIIFQTCGIKPERTAYACKTIRFAHRHLCGASVRWIVADDGSPEAHLQEVLQTLHQEGAYVQDVHSERHSYGRSINTAISCLETDIYLPLEDDWILSEPLNIDPYIMALHHLPQIGMIRLGYLNDGLRADLLFYKNSAMHNSMLFGFLRPEVQNPQYNFAGHPSLRHKRFHEFYGLYPEGLQPGATELGMADQYRQRAHEASAPWIVYPLQIAPYGLWAHEGAVQSYDWNGQG